MAEQRTYQGYLYQRSGPNEPWSLVGPTQAAGPIVIGQPDPAARFEAPKAQADALRAAAEAQAAAAEAPYAGTIARATVDKAVAEANAAQAKATQTTGEVQQSEQKAETKRIQRALQTDSVIEAINIAREQIGEGWSTGNFFGNDLWQGVPALGQNSANLDATLSGLQGSIINDTIAQLKELSASGASGYGSLTETEANRLAAAVGALQQTQDDEALRLNLARVERHYRNALALLNNEDPREPAVAEKYGILLPGDADDSDQAVGALTSEGRSERDPALRGANAHVAKMIKDGRSADDIRGYLNAVRPGLADRVENIDEAVAFARQNPSYEGDYRVDVESNWRPNSGLTKALGDIGMSPVGAAAIGAADVATMGFLDNMTPNPEMTRAVMEGVSEENPTAYLLGQLGGGVSSGLGVEQLLAKGGLTGIRGARVGDAIFGAGYGAGTADETNDSRIASALMGAGAGVLGGAAGRGAARVAGRSIAGVNDAAQRILHGAGVRLTPGQILGGGAKATEDRLAGLPVIGSAIGARRLEGLESFNEAAFNEALAPINATTGGRIAESGAQAAHDATSKAYRSALGGVEVVTDNQFEDVLLGAVQSLRSIPRVGDEAADSVGEIVNPTYFSADDTLTGTNMQPMVQELRKFRSGYQADPLGFRVGEGVRQAEDAVVGMFERQAPDVMPAYRAADEAYRNTSVIDDAILKALNQGGVFTPAQLGQAARANAKKFGGRRAAAEGRRPFYDLQRAGQETLPSQIPDSGTAGRLVLPAIIGGAAGGGSYATQEAEASDRAESSLGVAAVATALAAAPYSRTSRDIIQRLLLNGRPEIVEKAGELLIDRANIAGLLARPGAVEMVP